MKLLGITRSQMARNGVEETEAPKDVEMAEEEVKENAKDRFLLKWGNTINLDSKVSLQEQRPLSRTYKQTCPFTVEKKQGQALMSGSQTGDEIRKQGQKMSNAENLQTSIRKSMISSGCKTAQVDDLFGNVGKKLPESMVSSWEKMVKKDASMRYQGDADRQQGKHPTLDKLI